MTQENITSDKLVSVVIPCYNSGGTITACLNSVSEQTYKNVEIVIVDDGSTDDTISKINAFQNLCQRDIVIKIIQQKNSGPSTARNNGVENANGFLIAFLDSDDLWLPDKLQEQIQLFNNYETPPALIGARHPFGRIKPGIKGYREITLKQLLWCNYFQTSSVLIPKHLLIKNKFNVDQKYSEDYDLWMRLATQGKCLLLNQPVTKASELAYGGNGLSSKLWQMEKGELRNFKALFKNKNINWYEYCFFSTYSLLKFVRRAVISKK